MHNIKKRCHPLHWYNTQNVASRALANTRLVSMDALLMDSQERESVRARQALARTIAEFSYLLIPN